MAEVRRSTKDGVDHIVVDAPPSGEVKAKIGDHAFDERAGALYKKAQGGWVLIGMSDAPAYEEPKPEPKPKAKPEAKEASSGGDPKPKTKSKQASSKSDD